MSALLRLASSTMLVAVALTLLVVAIAIVRHVLAQANRNGIRRDGE